MSTPRLIPPTASVVVAAAAWDAKPLDGVDDATLETALQLARRNHVAGRLARAYGDRLAGELDAVQAMTQALSTNLAAVGALLARAGVVAVLVKLDPRADCEYGNFDVVVGDGFSEAKRALAAWKVRTSGHALEPDKVLFHPPDGPAAHIHRHLSWFGIDVISAERLRAGAVDAQSGWMLVPSPQDALRCYVAHGLFQNLTIDLAELITVRDLLTPAILAAARTAAAEEGWGWGFDRGVAAITRVIARLDAGLAPRLPVVLPLLPATLTGVEHAVGLMRRGRLPMAARELALRAPLVVAKRGHARRDSQGRGATALVGISGPDGVGKSTAAQAAVDLVAGEGGAALRVHPYGCLVCRTLGRYVRPALSAGGSTSSHGLHAAIDYAEMSLRIRFALLRARLCSVRGSTAGLRIVVTDRSPLDGLVKHAPPLSARTRTWFTQLARRYDRIVVLDAPASLMAEQDREHREVDLEARRGDFAAWAEEMSAVVRLPAAGRRPRQIAAALIGSLRWERAPVAAPDAEVAPTAAVATELSGSGHRASCT